jgi:sialidase-1
MKFLSTFSFVAGGILAYTAFLFFRYNAPIIKNLPLMAVVAGALILAVIVLSVRELFGKFQYPKWRRLPGILLLLTAGVLVYVFLRSAVLDYFQPFALYDDVIYLTLAAFLLLILRFVIQSVMNFIGKDVNLCTILLMGAMLAFVATFWTWGLLQKDFAYQNISGEPVALFPGGENGYAIYRIPSLLVIPQGSKLTDGTTLDDDLILAFAEARRNGSLDNGDVDLVLKRSLDGGQTWSDLIVVRQWEGGLGKIGNPTPVFDATTGILFVFHIAGSKSPYTTWFLQSLDGGLTFSKPVELGAGVAGPGHGIQVESGRLVIPAHVNGSSFAWISDDHGQSWRQGEPVGMGDESEIAETGTGSLVMMVRTNHPVSQPHGPLYQLFSFSQDNGQTWQPAQENPDIRTSICMTSIVQHDGKIFFSYPDDFYSRARMTVAISTDGGRTFPEKRLIYAGPAGYSDLGALSNGDLLLLFENGAVEYDEHLMLVRVPGE